MTTRTGIAQYYAERALEYEKVYLKPERQQDLEQLRTHLRYLLQGHRILEVACGTGYWTAVLAETATSIVATDINSEVLAIAQAKLLPDHLVQFVQADAWTLDDITGNFTAGFAGFWWSHLRKIQIAAFLRRFHSKLQPGALVVFIDNVYVEGSNHAISRVDDEGNTYQLRRLENGKVYEVRKNFPDEEEIRQFLGSDIKNFKYDQLSYYWLVSYRLGGK